MSDPAFPPIERDLAARLDLLVPPALPADFAARLAAAAQATPQVPPLAPLPAVRGRWRAIGQRARLGIAAGSLALVGLGSVSAAAAGFLGEPVNHAVHRLPVVGKLIEKVIPEKRHRHHAEAAHAAGLGHAQRPESPAGLRSEPRPAAADALPIAPAPLAPILGPGWRAGALQVAPPWRYPGPLPRIFPPGPERQAAIAALRAWRAEHPLPPEVIAARRQRRAAIMAERRAMRERQGWSVGQRRRGLVPMPPPDPVAAPPQAEAVPFANAPAFRGQMLDLRLDPGEREQLRLERRRARIEARRMGLDPLPPRIQRPRVNPGLYPHPPGEFRDGRRWRD